MTTRYLHQPHDPILFELTADQCRSVLGLLARTINKLQSRLNDGERQPVTLLHRMALMREIKVLGEIRERIAQAFDAHG